MLFRSVEGMNATGRKITASKLREGVSLPPVSTSANTIRNYYYDNDISSNQHQQEQPAPLKIISACGPFTTARSMDYQPFVDLMHVVLEQQPDVVVLTGPFVDVRQEAMKSGRPTVDIGEDEREVEIVVSYETVFAHKIAGLIEEALMETNDRSEEETLQTEFVLIPALEDATARMV